MRRRDQGCDLRVPYETPRRVQTPCCYAQWEARGLASPSKLRPTFESQFDHHNPDQNRIVVLREGGKTMNVPGFRAHVSLHGAMARYTSATFASDGTAPHVASVTAQWGLPIYGFYCGPRWGRTFQKYRLPPINAVDRVCMEHDKCYDNAKSLGDECTCDRSLISGMMYAQTSLLTFSLRARRFAQLAMVFFQLRVNNRCA
jgi:hypothetical protein